MALELTDLKTFLKQHGINWHNQYYNARRGFITTATDFKDVISFNNKPTTFKLEITDNKNYIDIFINEKRFVLYKEIIDKNTNKREIVEDKDLSAEWQKFIQEKQLNEQSI